MADFGPCWCHLHENWSTMLMRITTDQPRSLGFHRGFPLPKTGINSTLNFACFSSICSSPNGPILSGVWMASQKDKRKCFFSLLRFIKFMCTKNAKELVTGRKFIVNIKPQDMHVLLCLTLKMFSIVLCRYLNWVKCSLYRELHGILQEIFKVAIKLIKVTV